MMNVMMLSKSYPFAQCVRHASKMVKFLIYRYDPDTKKPPSLQPFDVDVTQFNHMYLDALLYIKNHMDSTLTLRRSCREGICGSCSMNIGGANCLACITPIPDIKEVKVYPLPGMYVIKDLVTDFERFYAHYRKIKPYLMRKNPLKRPYVQNIQSIRDQHKIEGLYECILCGCCTHSCPAYWWHSPTFLGSAALLNAYRWVIDSRDEFAKERLEELKDFNNLFRCHTINNCTYCCPKSLNPSLAISNLKQLAAGVLKKEVPDQVQ